MTRPVPFFAVLMLVGTSLGYGQAVTGDSHQENSSDFEGKKAGDRRELVPGIAFHWCPAGSFAMGSPQTELSSERKHSEEEDQVEVTLSTGFWLAETEVTQGQWSALMGTTPWRGNSFVKEDANNAATFVTHKDAVSYCERLTKQEQMSDRLPLGWKYSLPNEAQWEYACRAGTNTRFSFGDDELNLTENGWWGGIFGGGNTKNAQYAHPVGMKKPNPWNLSDMHGNVWEWCSDWKATRLEGGRDPQGPMSGKVRVIRGGGWDVDAVFCRSANRHSYSPLLRGCNLGFRIAAVRAHQQSP